MAKDKQSFVLYSDMIHIFNELTDEEAGKVVKHLFAYVNDQNPETSCRLTKIAFEPIRQQLKRDLKKYEATVEKRREIGRKGGIKSGESRTSKQTEAIGSKTKQTQANEADNVNDNVNVNDKEYKAPTHTEVKQQFFLHRRSGWTDAKCTVEATNFFDHYESVGWKVNGHLLANWQARVRKWISDERSDKKESTAQVGLNLPSSPRR